MASYKKFKSENGYFFMYNKGFAKIFDPKGNYVALVGHFDNTNDLKNQVAHQNQCFYGANKLHTLTYMPPKIKEHLDKYGMQDINHDMGL